MGIYELVFEEKYVILRFGRWLVWMWVWGIGVSVNIVLGLFI